QVLDVVDEVGSQQEEYARHERDVAETEARVEPTEHDATLPGDTPRREPSRSAGAGAGLPPVSLAGHGYARPRCGCRRSSRTPRPPRGSGGLGTRSPGAGRGRLVSPSLWA